MAVCIFAIWAVLARAQPITITGIVVDATGAAIPAAVVAAEVNGTAIASTVTDGDGRFTLGPLAAADFVLRASAAGFAPEVVRPVAEGVRIVLQPAAIFEAVTVTASRGSDQLVAPASSIVLSSAQLEVLPAVTVDDQLRNTAGFELTRRSSSRVANPSSQGVSMRGIPGNAGSRTLVMADGLPLNDPFGGWVYWNRVPEAAVDRVEVVRGAAGDLHGGDAVSGVVQLFTIAPARTHARAVFDAASPQTARASAYAGARIGPWSVALAGERVETDGTPIVAAAERGVVDVPAASDYGTAFATVRFTQENWQIGGRAAAYDERRGNGTPLVTNNTRWHQFAADARGLAAGGSWEIRGASARQRYFNNFSAVSADRSAERLTSEQWLPTDAVAFGAQWVRPWRSHVFLAGTEGHRTDGSVEETRYDASGVPSGPFTAGGIEQTTSAYARAAIAAGPRVSVIAGARADFWRSDPREASAPAHRVDFLSPRLSIAWQLSTVVAIHASATHAYRTPSLDELHRSSRVGNTTTSGNPMLEPETFDGVEAGVLLSGRRASARVTLFRSDLTNAITNVTLSATPTLITRMKQNADNIQSFGGEFEADWRLTPRLRLSGTLVLTSSRFRDEAKAPALEGKRVPQIPRYQTSVGAIFADPRLLTAAVYVRAAGRQFEDDVNQLPLDAFAVVDAYASRALRDWLTAFVAVENAFDVEYQTGKTPVTKIGTPRTVRGGLRVSLR